ncbi:MAG TPA: preprotein translocase subunit YajC [Candidatus Cloacimonadota bacterium]|nr:preprotein translocase subunit YajC [Candidatus Cloacimonadota bacterium]
MLNILLQAAPAAAKQGSPYTTLIFFGGMMLIMYFLMIRPQQKRQKETQQMLASLQVNDRVLTVSGIYGRVVSIKPDKDIVVVEIDETNKVRVDFQRSAIATILRSSENPAA